MQEAVGRQFLLYFNLTKVYGLSFQYSKFQNFSIQFSENCIVLPLI